MSEEVIKRLANIFANQNKILQKLADTSVDSEAPTLLPPPPPVPTPTLPSPAMPPTDQTFKWDKKKAEDRVLDNLHLITRHLRDQKDIPEETKKLFIQRLIKLYDEIVLTYD